MRAILGFSVFACLLVAGFIVYSKSRSTGGPAPAPAPSGPTKGYVAAVDISAHGVLTKALVMEAENPKGFPKEIVTAEKDLEGFVLRDDVKEGQPILNTNRFGKISPKVLEQAQSSERMLAIPNSSVSVEPSQKVSSAVVALPMGTRLRAKVGLESATLPAGAQPAAKKEPPKATSKESAPTPAESDHTFAASPMARQIPIFVTILFASSSSFDGPQLWDTRPLGEEGATGRDLLVAATPADARQVGRAARDNVLRFEKAGILSSSNLKEPKSEFKGKRLVDIDDVLRAKVNEEKRKERELERQRQEEIGRIRLTAQAEKVRESMPRPYCTIGKPQCGRWTTRIEPVEREVDVYKGSALTKVRLADSTRTVQEWLWYPGHAAGSMHAGLGGPPPIPGFSQSSALLVPKFATR